MDFKTKTSVINVSQLQEQAAQKSAKRSACFIVLAGSQTGRMFKLDDDEFMIGRSSESLICVEDDGVSRRHARIIRMPDGSVVLEDMQSTNGTFCNGQRIDNQSLQDGDRIQIGTTTILKFSFQDTVEEEFQRRQYESATRDALTGCFNKKFFMERMPSEIAFAVRHRRTLSLAMFDIDHFKKVNDTYGHLAGDYVLKNVAHALQKTLRADDMLCRYGGEEFALIMRESEPPEKPYLAADRLRKLVAGTPFDFEKIRIPVTISVGVGTWNTSMSEDPTELIKMADECLYTAKNEGRNRTVSNPAI